MLLVLNFWQCLAPNSCRPTYLRRTIMLRTLTVTHWWSPWQEHCGAVVINSYSFSDKLQCACTFATHSSCCLHVLSLLTGLHYLSSSKVTLSITEYNMHHNTAIHWFQNRLTARAAQCCQVMNKVHSLWTFRLQHELFEVYMNFLWTFELVTDQEIQKKLFQTDLCYIKEKL